MEKIKTYKKLTDIEHVLHRPDTYIGSVINRNSVEYIIKDNKIIDSDVNWNPGLYKIFDEIISNSVDESKRNKKLDAIKINIDKEKITVFDNGGIEIVQLPEYKNIYLPEFLFGELRTSSNYDDTDQRETIGLNGIGAVCTNIFSSKFIIETSDKKSVYRQIFRNNLSKKEKPLITQSKDKKGYTVITFYPDLKRFNLDEITDDNIAIFKKRVIDLAGTNSKINFYFNDELITIKSFQDYCNLYNIDSDNLFIEKNDKWEIGVSVSDNGFKQISFSNGVITKLGGTHVEYIFDQIVDFLRPLLLKKHKLDIKPYEIRNNLFLFVNATIINNRFDSQTKEKLSTDSKKFGTELILSNGFLNKLFKSEIIERILDYKRSKLERDEQIELRKLNKQVERLKVPNLYDCRQRKNSSIRIFEGKSAGDSSLKYRDVNTQALFLLRGKILNTYNLKAAKILKNKEIAGLISALGLELGNPSIKNLRYDKIIIFADSDRDGDNIVSLILNFLASNWIDLFKEEKVYRGLTPLMIIKDNKKQIDIYSFSEYDNYIKNNTNKNISISYKKGLAALSDNDYKKIMISPTLLKISYDDLYKESIAAWFGKDSNKRKEMLIDI